MSESKNAIGNNIQAENKHLGHIRRFFQSRTNESTLPTLEGLGYKSTVGIWGGKLIEDNEGKLIYQTTGFISRMDREGDTILRTFDEHIAKRPLQLLKKHPKWFLRHFLPNPLRYRGTPQEIAHNARRLGLGEVYVLHPKGIEIKRPEVYKKGIALQDIYRAEEINSSLLKGINRFAALAEAAKYIRSIHDQFGAVGELLPNDIIFQSIENGHVQKPILNLPDEIYNPKKEITETAKKATDLLDFLVSIGFEELRKSDSLTEVQKAIKTILENYNDSTVIKTVESFAKRGRLVMVGDEQIINLPNTFFKRNRALFAIHNKARLSFHEDITAHLRDMIIESCHTTTV